MLCKRDDCTGCEACKAACPSGAISLVKEGGFFYPSVDFSICQTNSACSGLCTKVCPTLSFQPSGFSPAMYKVDVADALLASREAFSVFARQKLLNGGVVCAPSLGADFLLHLCIIEDVEALSTVCSLPCYYSQGSADAVYRRCRDLLEDGRELLFFGAPCQVAGLKSFLGKSYSLLVTVDYICAGTPSPLVFLEYLKSLPGAVAQVSFDDSRYAVSEISVVYDDGNGFHAPLQENVYGRALQSALFNRRCCFRCKYARVPRVGDITLGDLRIAAVDATGLDEFSLLSVNSVKGVGILKQVAASLVLEKLSSEVFCSYAPRFFSPGEPSSLRDSFFADYEKSGYAYVEKKYLKESVLSRFFHSLFKK